MSSFCHGDERLPDTGGICCAGAAIYGPDRCTCWRPVYDREQHDPIPAVPQLRHEMCADCAYRPGSPEKLDDPELLERLAASGTPFFCHDGMRRPVVLRHPSGIEIPGHPAEYDPPQIGAVPFRADGQPGLLCAGWAARGRAIEAQVGREAAR